MTALRLAAMHRWQGLPAWCRSPLLHGGLAFAAALVLLLWFGSVVQGVVQANEHAHTNGHLPAAAVHAAADASVSPSPRVDGV